MIRFAALLVSLALVPAALVADEHIQIEVACRGSEPIAARVTMVRPGAVVLPVMALFRYCEASSGKPT